jgi:hypothetical protein
LTAPQKLGQFIYNCAKASHVAQFSGRWFWLKSAKSPLFSIKNDFLLRGIIIALK